MICLKKVALARDQRNKKKKISNESKSHATFAIPDAAKQSNVKEADCEAAIKNWLKYASDRDGGRKKRAEKQKGTIIVSYQIFMTSVN